MDPTTWAGVFLSNSRVHDQTIGPSPVGSAAMQRPIHQGKTALAPGTDVTLCALRKLLRRTTYECFPPACVRHKVTLTTTHSRRKTQSDRIRSYLTSRFQQSSQDKWQYTTVLKTITCLLMVTAPTHTRQRKWNSDLNEMIKGTRDGDIYAHSHNGTAEFEQIRMQKSDYIKVEQYTVLAKRIIQRLWGAIRRMKMTWLSCSSVWPQSNTCFVCRCLVFRWTLLWRFIQIIGYRICGWIEF